MLPRSLRSSSMGLLKIPWSNDYNYGERSFPVYAIKLSNGLQDHLRLAVDQPSFKRDLQTYLFRQSFFILRFFLTFTS